MASPETNTPLDGSLPYFIENVWEALTPELEAEVLAFWEECGLVRTETDLRKRAQQAILLARDIRRKVIGVATVFNTFVQRLNNHVYVYRTLVAPPFRKIGVAISMLQTARDFLNDRYREGIDRTCIGLMFILENPELGKQFKQAIWPRTGFIFLGYNRKRQQVRIFYFDGAVI